MLSPDTSAILDNAACGLVQTDVDGNIRWANRVFCNWVGFKCSELAGQRKMQQLFTVGGRIFHQTHWVPLLQMQMSVSEVKFDVVHRDGHSIPMVLNAIRRVSDGLVVHDIAAFVARDRDRYERELLSATKALQALAVRSTELEEEARDRATFAEQMMGIVSHDLRNPLATIELSAYAALGSSVNDEQQKALARITRATQRATRLIHDLLDFTSARLGKGLSVSRVDVDLHGIMSDAVDDLRMAYPGRSLLHNTRGGGRCEADPDRLMQVVGNLVTNAITYGLVDSPVTIISGIEDDRCFVSVHNAGRPINDETLPQLFVPMARGVAGADGSRSVGLGLYIVREIAHAHGGEVSVVSTAQAGTTFTVQFPCHTST